MDELLGHFKVAARKLFRAPLFASIAISTLAVGIGANAAIFSVVNSVLVEPLPYPRADELVSLWHVAPGMGVTQAEQSQGTYFTYRSDAKTLTGIGLWDDLQVAITGVGDPERVDAIRVTDGTLSLLGATPILGRGLTADDDVPGAPSTVVLSHGYWQRRFGASASALGQTIQIDGRPAEIIGVLRRDFRVLGRAAAVYVPARFDPARAEFGNFAYRAIGRLAPGATMAAVEDELTRLIPVAVRRYAGTVTQEVLDQAGFAPLVRPLKKDLVGDVSTILWILLGTVGLVLLLACANVANLFLVQAELRQREVAVRTALGASRRQLMVGLLVESVVLGVLGGVAGLALAAAGLRLLVAVGPESLPRLSEIGIDGEVLAFTLIISLLAAVTFGLFPALRYGRAPLHSIIKEGGRAAGAGRERHRVRNALVVVQVALALVLLIGSGLMVRSVRALRVVDPGFRAPEHVLVFSIYVPDAEVGELDRVARLESELLARLRETPGVISAGGTSLVTMTNELSNSSPFVVEGRPVDLNQLPPIRSYRFIAPGYHETMGSPIVAGRALTWADVETRAPVVLLNDELARIEFGSPAAAIGKRIRYLAGPTWWEIVGVTGSIRYAGVNQPPLAVIYFPLAVQGLWDNGIFVDRSLDYVVRTEGDPRALLPRIKAAVAEVNPHLPVAQVRTLAEILEGSMARAAFAMVMLSIAAAVALGLGLVGIYGVISYIVTQRTREIGVRIALGARPATVRAMVIRQAARPTGIGVAAGLAGAALLTRFMAGLLYGVRPLDLITYGGVTLAIAGVALLASYLPARRAARVDPVIALRAD
jgi:predicted permease